MVKHWSERNRAVPAAFVLLEKDGQVLLMRRGKDSGYCVGDYSLPSGHVERAESPRAAAIRETEEEIGVRIKPAELELVHIAYYVAKEGTHERVSFFFRCRNWQGEPQNREPGKCDELTWRVCDDLPSKLTPEVERLFVALQSGQIFTEAGFEIKEA